MVFKLVEAKQVRKAISYLEKGSIPIRTNNCDCGKRIQYKQLFPHVANRRDQLGNYAVWGLMVASAVGTLDIQQWW